MVAEYSHWFLQTLASREILTGFMSTDTRSGPNPSQNQWGTFVASDKPGWGTEMARI